jgi:hypothetical protein
MLSVEKVDAAIQRYQIAAVNNPDKMYFYFTLAQKALEIKYRFFQKPMSTYIDEDELVIDNDEPVFECFLPKGFIYGL